MLRKKHRQPTPEYNPENDPFLIKVGMQTGVKDLPADGWPEHVNPKVIEHILSFFPDDELYPTGGDQPKDIST